MGKSQTVDTHFTLQEALVTFYSRENVKSTGLDVI
jgi:hypothetical protein